MGNALSADANAALARRFYEAFARRDAEAMATCYHDDATFSDPVFPRLRGEEVRDMWRMLVANAREFSLTFDDVVGTDDGATVTWVARYRFGRKGRSVRNVIRARLTMRDGLIVRHEDAFSLWRWSSQALGWGGAAFGWLPFVRARVRKNAASQLARFRRRDG